MEAVLRQRGRSSRRRSSAMDTTFLDLALILSRRPSARAFLAFCVSVKNDPLASIYLDLLHHKETTSSREQNRLLSATLAKHLDEASQRRRLPKSIVTQLERVRVEHERDRSPSPSSVAAPCSSSPSAPSLSPPSSSLLSLHVRSPWQSSPALLSVRAYTLSILRVDVIPRLLRVHQSGLHHWFLGEAEYDLNDPSWLDLLLNSVHWMTKGVHGHCVAFMQAVDELEECAPPERPELAMQICERFLQRGAPQEVPLSMRLRVDLHQRLGGAGNKRTPTSGETTLSPPLAVQSRTLSDGARRPSITVTQPEENGAPKAGLHGLAASGSTGPTTPRRRRLKLVNMALYRHGQKLALALLRTFGIRSGFFAAVGGSGGISMSVSSSPSSSLRVPTLLRDKTYACTFREFAKSLHCEEPVLFFDAVQRLKQNISKLNREIMDRELAEDNDEEDDNTKEWVDTERRRLVRDAQKIFEEFVQSRAPKQVPLTAEFRELIFDRVFRRPQEAEARAAAEPEESVASTDSELEFEGLTGSEFDELESVAIATMTIDILPKFSAHHGLSRHHALPTQKQRSSRAPPLSLPSPGGAVPSSLMSKFVTVTVPLGGRRRSGHQKRPSITSTTSESSGLGALDYVRDIDSPLTAPPALQASELELSDFAYPGLLAASEARARVRSHSFDASVSVQRREQRALELSGEKPSALITSLLGIEAHKQHAAELALPHHRSTVLDGGDVSSSDDEDHHTPRDMGRPERPRLYVPPPDHSQVRAVPLPVVSLPDISPAAPLATETVEFVDGVRSSSSSVTSARDGGTFTWDPALQQMVLSPSAENLVRSLARFSPPPSARSSTPRASPMPSMPTSPITGSARNGTRLSDGMTVRAVAMPHGSRLRTRRRSLPVNNYEVVSAAAAASAAANRAASASPDATPNNTPVRTDETGRVAGPVTYQERSRLFQDMQRLYVSEPVAHAADDTLLAQRAKQVDIIRIKFPELLRLRRRNVVESVPSPSPRASTPQKRLSPHHRTSSLEASTQALAQRNAEVRKRADADDHDGEQGEERRLSALLMLDNLQQADSTMPEVSPTSAGAAVAVSGMLEPRPATPPRQSMSEMDPDGDEPPSPQSPLSKGHKAKSVSFSEERTVVHTLHLYESDAARYHPRLPTAPVQHSPKSSPSHRFSPHLNVPGVAPVGILKRTRLETFEEALQRVFIERERESRRYLMALQMGAQLKKMNSMQKADTRWFEVNNDGSEISWQKTLVSARKKSKPALPAEISDDEDALRLAQARNKKRSPSWFGSLIHRRKSRALADVRDIRYGTFWSSRFDRYNQQGLPPWLGFSLFFEDRTLDIVCEDDEDVTTWFLGLQSLCPLGKDYMSKGALLWVRAKLKVEFQAWELNIPAKALWAELIRDAFVTCQAMRLDTHGSASLLTVDGGPQ